MMRISGMEKSLSLYSLSSHYFFPVLNLRYCNLWRSCERSLFYPQIFPRNIWGSINTSYMPLLSPLSLKKKARFLLQRVSSFSFMLQWNKKRVMSASEGTFLLCLETYVHLQKHKDDPFTMPPPPREGGISLYLNTAGCFHKLTSFPDFHTSVGHKNPRQINQWTHYWKNLNNTASKIWFFGCLSFGDRGYQERYV